MLEEDYNVLVAEIKQLRLERRLQEETVSILRTALADILRNTLVDVQAAIEANAYNSIEREMRLIAPEMKAVSAKTSLDMVPFFAEALLARTFNPVGKD